VAHSYEPRKHQEREDPDSAFRSLSPAGSPDADWEEWRLHAWPGARTWLDLSTMHEQKRCGSRTHRTKDPQSVPLAVDYRSRAPCAGGVLLTRWIDWSPLCHEAADRTADVRTWV